MAAGYISGLSSSGTVKVVGSDTQNDTVVVDVASRGQLRVSLQDGTGSAGREWKTFDQSKVKKIQFYGKGGHDSFTNKTSVNSVAYLGNGNDYASGGSGRDIFFAGLGNDRLYGEGGNDLLSGGTGNDTLSGGSGHDLLAGGSGNDLLSGGTGNDVIHGESGRDRLYGSFGNDTLRGGSGRDSVFGQEGNDVLYGGSGNDHLSGGDGHDKLYGKSGNDVLNGGIGNDKLYGHSGKDLLKGGAGNDHLDGGKHNDKLYGHSGNDLLKGGLGNDRLDGGSNNDKLYGHSGNDYLLGRSGHDRIYGGSGNDTLTGGSGNDRLYGQSGDDVIYGGSGNDHLEGGKNNDKLYGESGLDVLYGQDGDDVLFGGVGDWNYFSGGTGIDRILAHGTNYWVVRNGNAEDAVIRFLDKGKFKTKVFGRKAHFSPGAWSNKEIMRVDEVFADLQKATGNTNLLKTADGGEITYTRNGSQEGGRLVNGLNKSYEVDGKYGNQIMLFDKTFRQGDRFAQTIFHEHAHNFDTRNPNWEQWKQISGWEKRPAFYVPENTTLSGDGWWTYTGDPSQFARRYGTSNPREDFATYFAKIMMDDANRTYYGSTYKNWSLKEGSGRWFASKGSLMAEKTQFMRDWLSRLA